MEIVLVSKHKMKELRDDQERHELEELRAKVRLESITDAENRFVVVTENCNSALRIAEDAYTSLVEDDLDDYETAKDKADRLEAIERQHERAIAAWENQLRRVNWEARQAQK